MRWLQPWNWKNKPFLLHFPTKAEGGGGGCNLTIYSKSTNEYIFVCNVIFKNSLPLQNKPCGLLTCQRLQTCVTLSSGQQISATIKQHCCHSNRFITYGNPDVIVTWSSVFSSSDPSYSAYWLNSYYGWSPAAADQSQWIQVHVQWKQHNVRTRGVQ